MQGKIDLLADQRKWWLTLYFRNGHGHWRAIVGHKHAGGRTMKEAYENAGQLIQDFKLRLRRNPDNSASVRTDRGDRRAIFTPYYPTNKIRLKIKKEVIPLYDD